MKLYKLAPLCGALLLALVSCGCSRLKARDQLNKGVAAFLTLWKDADPDIPILKQAKEEYAKLQ